MARKRVEEVIAEFESWDDVNQALGTIGDNQRMVEGFEAEMQEKIDAAKAEAEAKSRIYLEGTKRLEAQICAFAETHRDDMDGKKSKTLNFGSVGFRKSTPDHAAKGAGEAGGDREAAAGAWDERLCEAGGAEDRQGHPGKVPACGHHRGGGRRKGAGHLLV